MFANELYDEDNKKVVRVDTGYCFHTAIGKSWQCVWAKTLVDSQISARPLHPARAPEKITALKKASATWLPGS
jgi:hypothetical protein